MALTKSEPKKGEFLKRLLWPTLFLAFSLTLKRRDEKVGGEKFFPSSTKHKKDMQILQRNEDDRKKCFFPTKTCFYLLLEFVRVFGRLFFPPRPTSKDEVCDRPTDRRQVINLNIEFTPFFMVVSLCGVPRPTDRPTERERSIFSASLSHFYSRLRRQKILSPRRRRRTTKPSKRTKRGEKSEMKLNARRRKK